MSITEVGYLRYGLLLDFYEIYLQEKGKLKPYQEHFIDEIIPDGF